LDAGLNPSDKNLKNILTRRKASLYYAGLAPNRFYFSQEELAIFYLDRWKTDVSVHARYLFLDASELWHNDIWGDWGIAIDRNYFDITDLLQFRAPTDKKDFCQDCKNEELYWQAMAAKCSICHKIILGG
jgi:hypothetical protein